MLTLNQVYPPALSNPDTQRNHPPYDITMRIHLIFALLTAVAASQQDDPTVAGRNAETASLPLRDAAGKVMRDVGVEVVLS